MHSCEFIGIRMNSYEFLSIPTNHKELVRLIMILLWIPINSYELLRIVKNQSAFQWISKMGLGIHKITKMLLRNWDFLAS